VGPERALVGERLGLLEVSVRGGIGGMKTATPTRRRRVGSRPLRSLQEPSGRGPTRRQLLPGVFQLISERYVSARKTTGSRVVLPSRRRTTARFYQQEAKPRGPVEHHQPLDHGPGFWRGMGTPGREARRPSSTLSLEVRCHAACPGRLISPRQAPVSRPRLSTNSLKRSRSPATRRETTPIASPTFSVTPSGSYSS
jgi:hypothetical protein